MQETIINESAKDLRDDFEELIYLYSSYSNRLTEYKKILKEKKEYFHKDIYDFLLQTTTNYLKLIAESLDDLHANLSQIPSPGRSPFCHLPGVFRHTDSYWLGKINILSQLKNKYFNLLRNYVPLISGLITSSDSQSPSYNHSLFPQAGRQTGKIIGTINDYKRDQHLDGKELEKNYLKEYIDAPFKFSLKCYATNSGMAAFCTILNYLIMEKHAQGKILMGENSYFENKDLLTKSFSDNLISVDENNISNLLSSIHNHQPDIIFFDSLSNTSSVTVPDLTQIINYLITNCKKPVCLVIDNTCLPVFFQPMKLVVGKRSKITLIQFESLNKYLQFGMDKTTAGIITAYGKDVGKLYHYRDHLGTNISDIGSLMIPYPNRKLLEKRLKRLQRNASILASCLQEKLNSKLKIRQIIYPDLDSHPGNQIAKDIGFFGSYFTIEFHKKNISLYTKFINQVISEAKKMKINIVAGTSFGLNTTRIYLTSLRTDCGEPFVRVAVGTENRMQMEVIKDVFQSAIRKIS